MTYKARIAQAGRAGSTRTLQTTSGLPLEAITAPPSTGASNWPTPAIAKKNPLYAPMSVGGARLEGRVVIGIDPRFSPMVRTKTTTKNDGIRYSAN